MPFKDVFFVFTSRNKQSIEVLFQIKCIAYFVTVIVVGSYLTDTFVALKWREWLSLLTNLTADLEVKSRYFFQFCQLAQNFRDIGLLSLENPTNSFFRRLQIID